MIKPDDPRDLAVNLLTRSICSIQVASVICDSMGRIVAWGWNNMGPTGYGICAERHAISRGNRDRFHYGTIYVAGKYKDRIKMVKAKPCDECQQKIDGFGMTVVYRDATGEWK